MKTKADKEREKRMAEEGGDEEETLEEKIDQQRKALDLSKCTPITLELFKKWKGQKHVAVHCMAFHAHATPVQGVALPLPSSPEWDEGREMAAVAVQCSAVSVAVRLMRSLGVLTWNVCVCSQWTRRPVVLRK